MLAESRTTIKSWIERIVGSDVSVFCDFVPDYESSQSVVCFNLQDVELTRTLQFEKSCGCRCGGRQSARSKF